MTDTMLGRMCLIFWPELDEKKRVDLLATVMLDWALITPLVIMGGLLPYGRYTYRQKMVYVDSKIGWVLQESPSFLIPLHAVWTARNNLPSLPALILLAAFLIHYGYRVLVYSLKIRGGKPSPLSFVFLAALFCACNGYMQANFLLHYSSYPMSWMTEWNFMVGIVLFAIGLYTNIRCDNILRNLRKPGETGYKIPRGWVFDYVSGGNYFGESLEWTGWALACWSVQGFSFAVFATTFLLCRSVEHHKWYHSNFRTYPKDRKIFIPFVW
ncbi:3-oxo-5-alpha-steroid 4-dehydrogenase 1-like [Clavelina lepadiformis]|uniref:3-oxo-5-alpha-steroid 4-dehydrogenase 1-like n=1 Tax=Clavelina lepadiformis TaxID=159417 RepID=UPI00404182AD